MSTTGVALYGRSYSLTISPPGAPFGVAYGNIGKLASPLRIGFEIEKGVKTNPDKGKVSVFNLDERTRKAISSGYIVRLRAGYTGFTETLFAGVVAKVTSERQGPDIITTMEGEDAADKLLYATFHKSFQPGVHLASILGEVGTALGVEPGTVIGLPDVTYARGFAAHGSCKDILKTLCKPLGLEPTVINGRLNILPIGEGNGRQAIVLTQATGLIGVPSVNGDGVQFDALLNPKLVPGQIVLLTVKGDTSPAFYKIRSSKCEGDTYDAKWGMTCICQRIEGKITVLTPAQGFNYQDAVL